MNKWQVKIAEGQEELQKALAEGWEPYGVLMNGAIIFHFLKRLSMNGSFRAAGEPMVSGVGRPKVGWGNR